MPLGLYNTPFSFQHLVKVLTGEEYVPPLAHVVYKVFNIFKRRYLCM